jgi:hypothetical protein
MRFDGRLLALVAAGASFLVPSAMAQSLMQAPPQTPTLSPWARIAPPPEETDEDATEPTQAADADPMKDVDVSTLDWTALNLEAAALFDRPAAKVVGRGKPAARSGSAALDWSNQNNANGTAGVSVKQAVSPFWNAQIGADMTVTRQPGTMSELLAETAQNGGSVPQSGGTAWAAVTAPGAGSIWDKTAIEARVDPGSDQSRIGTTLTKAVPLVDHYNLTIQNAYNLSQQGMLPLPGAAPRTDRSFSTEQSAQLKIGDTGTSIIAGQSLSTSNDRWLRKLGAEQKLYGGVTLSGSVGETAQGFTNTSIAAGYKRSW